MHRFDSADVKSNSLSPDEYLIWALYGGHFIDDHNATVYKINLFTFSAKYPTLGFSHSNRLFPKPLASVLRNMIEHGIVTQELKPFILERHTHTQCNEWGLINLHLNRLRKERSLLLQHCLEQGNEEKLSTILARATNNYELLIGSIRLLSTLDYATTVEVVKKTLHLPHVKKMTALLYTNIEALHQLLQKTIQNLRLLTPQMIEGFFENVSTLIGDRNAYQHELNSLLNAIAVKLQTPNSDILRPSHVKRRTPRVEIEKIIDYREAVQNKAKQSHGCKKELATENKSTPKVNDILTANACNQFRVVARQLFIVNKEAFNKLAPCADQSFFKNTSLLIETAQAVLRKEAVAFLKNNHPELSQDLLNAYLKEDHPGDEHTLTAIAEVLKLTIIVADNTQADCFKLKAYPTGSLTFSKFRTYPTRIEVAAYLKKSILLIQSKEEINAAGTHLDDKLTRALKPLYIMKAFNLIKDNPSIRATAS